MSTGALSGSGSTCVGTWLRAGCMRPHHDRPDCGTGRHPGGRWPDRGSHGTAQVTGESTCADPAAAPFGGTPGRHIPTHPGAVARRGRRGSAHSTAHRLAGRRAPGARGRGRSAHPALGAPGRVQDRAGRGAGGMDPIPVRGADRGRRPGAGADRHLALHPGCDPPRGHPSGRPAARPVGNRGRPTGLRRRDQRRDRRPGRRQPHPRRPTPWRRPGQRAGGPSRVGRRGRARPTRDRGGPGQTPRDRPIRHPHHRRRTARAGSDRAVHPAVQLPGGPGDPRGPAEHVCRHPGVDAGHGHRQAAAPVHRCSRHTPAGGEPDMITGLQLAILGGGLVGAGIAMLVWRLAPADPDLGETLARLSPEHARRPAETVQGAADSRERLGRWAMKTLPAAAWARVPASELAVLRIPVARFYGEKVLYAFLGLLIPPLLTGFFAVMGLRFPVLIPAAATLGFAVLMFFLPDYNARDDAKKARLEFARALGAYIDLVALERNSGSGSRQAMEVAAEIGDSWVFRRLGEELARSRWSGQAPWEALHGLAQELDLPELDDLADIMRLSGEEGAQIYTQLRARSASMRAAMLGAELTKANEVGERMSIPMSLLGVIFMAILVAPALLRVMGGNP